MATIPRRILVATDFSSAADRAQSVALSLAGWFDADLDFVHVRVLLDEPHLKEEHQLELERLLVASDLQRRQALEKSPSKSGLSINTHLIRGLSAAEAIVETSGDLGCELIVMGTHGRRGFSHLLLGSVAENTVRTASVPVLSVRPDATLPSDGIRNILVPHDFSDSSAHALRIAATWAEAFGAGRSPAR
jgi:nucleotide-binding universal stress UspA family protein